MTHPNGDKPIVLAPWSLQILGGDADRPIPLYRFDDVDPDILLEVVLMDSRKRTLKKYVVGIPGGVIQAPSKTENMAYRYVPRTGRRLGR